MDLHKLGFKFHASGFEQFDLLELIPVYHRWIQQHALSDLLIDVADYTHVPEGPGVLLVAHEGNYGLDETDGKRGVVYYSKHPIEGDLATRLATVARKALQAGKLLTDEPAVAGALRLNGVVQFFANDRLAAPNTDETYAALEPAVRSLFDKLFAGAPYTVERQTDPKERFGLTATVQAPVTVDALLERVAA